MTRSDLFKTAVLAAALLAGSGPAFCSGADFLVPGVSLRSVSMDVGSSVQYMIISEAYNIFDTSTVTLSVPDYFDGGYMLEIVSAPYPPDEKETVTVRLEMLKGATEAVSADEFRAHIRKILIRQGEGDFRQPDSTEIDDFDLERVFLRDREGMTETSMPAETISTRAGSFDCAVKRFARSDTMRVKLGGVDADRCEQEESTLWISDKVPFWGLVKSRVERSGWTRLASARGTGRPRPKVTVTESILLSASRQAR